MINTSRFLNEIRSAVGWEQARRGIHLLLTDLSDQISNGFQQLGIQTTGKVQPPPPIENLSVVANNGTVHAVITHNASIQKNIRYFIAASMNDPSFGQPGSTHIFDLGASRSLFTSLPNTDGAGKTINWYFKTYPQYQGSDPAPHTNFGTKFAPTIVNVGGTAQFSPFASTGSGTGIQNGSQSSVGMGIDLQRAAVGPKRAVV